MKYSKVSYYTNRQRRFGVSLFIYISAEVVKGQPYHLVIILLHHAPPNLASVLVLFVIFGGHFNILIHG